MRHERKKLFTYSIVTNCYFTAIFTIHTQNNDNSNTTSWAAAIADSVVCRRPKWNSLIKKCKCSRRNFVKMFQLSPTLTEGVDWHLYDIHTWKKTSWDLVVERPHTSTRAVTRRVPVSQRLHSFHAHKIPALETGDYPLRVVFWKWFLRQSALQQDLAAHVLFTYDRRRYFQYAQNPMFGQQEIHTLHVLVQSNNASLWVFERLLCTVSL